MNDELNKTGLLSDKNINFKYMNELMIKYFHK